MANLALGDIIHLFSATQLFTKTSSLLSIGKWYQCRLLVIELWDCGDDNISIEDGECFPAEIKIDDLSNSTCSNFILQDIEWFNYGNTLNLRLRANIYDKYFRNSEMKITFAAGHSLRVADSYGYNLKTRDL